MVPAKGTPGSFGSVLEITSHDVEVLGAGADGPDGEPVGLPDGDPPGDGAFVGDALAAGGVGELVEGEADGLSDGEADGVRPRSPPRPPSRPEIGPPLAWGCAASGASPAA